MSNTPDDAADAVPALELEEVVRKRVLEIIRPEIDKSILSNLSSYNPHLRTIVRDIIREYMCEVLDRQASYHSKQNLPY